MKMNIKTILFTKTISLKSNLSKECSKYKVFLNKPFEKTEPFSLFRQFQRQNRLTKIEIIEQI